MTDEQLVSPALRIIHVLPVRIPIKELFYFRLISNLYPIDKYQVLQYCFFEIKKKNYFNQGSSEEI